MKLEVAVTEMEIAKLQTKKAEAEAELRGTDSDKIVKEWTDKWIEANQRATSIERRLDAVSDLERNVADWDNKVLEARAGVRDAQEYNRAKGVCNKITAARRRNSMQGKDFEDLVRGGLGWLLIVHEDMRCTIVRDGKIAPNPAPRDAMRGAEAMRRWMEVIAREAGVPCTAYEIAEALRKEILRIIHMTPGYCVMGYKEDSGSKNDLSLIHI